MNINVDFAEAAGGKGFPRSLGTFLLNPCFHAVALFRLSALLYRCHLEPLAKIVWCLNRMLYHVDLDYKAKLAPGVSPRPRARRCYRRWGRQRGAAHSVSGCDHRRLSWTSSRRWSGGLLAAPIREQRYRVHELLHFRTNIRWGRRDCEGGSNSYEGRWALGQDINGGCFVPLVSIIIPVYKVEKRTWPLR